MMNVSVSVNNQKNGVFVDDYIWNPSTCDYECNKTCKVGEQKNIKSCSCKKRLFGKLALTYDDEILDTTEVASKDLNCAT